MTTLYYIHDPMCSWCWGFRPTWQQVKAQLLEQFPDLDIHYVLGGLAPDSDQPMPEETQQYVRANWQRIQEAIPGTEFNYDFWTKCQPRRSTYPACRAVLSACLQDEDSEDAMVFAIQQAYYLNAKNPSDIDVLAECATSIGLNPDSFLQDIRSERVEGLLQQQFLQYQKLAFKSGIRGFPSLVVYHDDYYQAVAVNYQDADEQYAQISALLEVANKR